MIDGLIAVTEVAGIEGATVDLGSGQLVTVEAIIRQILELLGSTMKPHFGALPNRPLEEIRLADIEHTRRILGWQPKVSLREGLRRTVDWHVSPGAGNQTGAQALSARRMAL